MSKWHWKLWLMGVFVGIYYFGNMMFATYLFVNADRSLYFACCFSLGHLPVILITVWLRKTHRVHIHHYTGAMMGLLVLGYPHWYIIFTCGWSNGVMVEGGARWGYDPHWYPIKEVSDESQTMKDKKVS